MNDLTEGKPEKVLIKFSLPMFVSVIFQQMYSIADSVIAGQFAGENALAAVGASYPITMIFMAVAVGSNIGCSVIISQFFGAKKYEKMKTAVSTTLISSIAISIFLTIFGLIFSRKMMTVVNTPEDIFYLGDLYLRIYIGGFLFLFLYNVCTGIFNSLGDSKTPLIFLIGSSVGNVVLDYIFVAVYGMGVAGVAWATFIAQSIAGMLSFAVIAWRIKNIKTEKSYKLFSADMLARISYVAVPSILQQSFVSVGNIFIQRLINGFGYQVMAGYSAAIKLNTFSITSFSTLANGLSSFSAQNIGAKKPERVNRGFRAGIILAVIVAIPFFTLFFFCGGSMISVFTSEKSADVIGTGVDFLRIVSPFYFVILVKLMADSVLRGSGAMIPFMITTFSDLLIRVVLAYIFSAHFGAVGIWLSWPVGWTVAAIISVVFYCGGCWKKHIV